MKAFKRLVLWMLVCLLIWAPIHVGWLIPLMSQMIRDGEMTMGTANLIGLYSSLFPLALVAAVNYYAFVKGDWP